MKVNFEVCEYNVEKSGKCIICNKQIKIKEKFYQTLNPFNKNKNGETKSREEIYNELKEQVKEWRLKPIIHRKCEK